MGARAGADVVEPEIAIRQQGQGSCRRQGESIQMNAKLGKIALENSIEISLAEACYFGFFILLSVTKGMGLYEGQKLFELLVIPAFLLAIVKILITPYTKRQWVMQILFLLLAVLVLYESHERGILFLTFAVLGMKNISVKKVFHTGLWVWSLCAVVLCIFSFFRLEHTIYRVHDKLGLGYIFRWSLGFTHPNILHITYFTLCALLLYEMEDNYQFRHFICLMAGNMLVFLYSVSYTGFGIVTILLVGCLYVRVRPRLGIAEKISANLVLPVCLISSFVLPLLLYDEKYGVIIQKLNSMVNTRIRLAELFLKPEYFSLFGVDISEVVKSSVSIDNSYVWGYINYGLIPFAIIILGYFALSFYITYKQRTRELVILVCFLVAGWTEPLLFNTSFKNFTLIFLGSLLFVQKEGAKEYCLFPHAQREIVIPLAGLPDRLLAAAHDVWNRCKVKIAGWSVVGMALGMILCAVLYTAPEGYVVPRVYTDWLEKSSVYPESRDDPSYAGWKIMNYTDADTPMQLVEGKAVVLETVRYYTGSVLIGGFCGGIFGIICFGLRQNSMDKQTAKRKG